MDKIDRQPVITRYELLGLQELQEAHANNVKQNNIKTEVQRIKSQVLHAALEGQRSYKSICYHFKYANEVVELLKAMFPDSKVELVVNETKQERILGGGHVEEIIRKSIDLILDWS